MTAPTPGGVSGAVARARENAAGGATLLVQGTKVEPVVFPDVPEVRTQVEAALADWDAAVTEGGPSDEWDRKVIRQAIDAFAGTGHPFSMNDVRPLLPVVRKALLAKAFVAAERDGVVRKVGTTPSTLRSTRGHHINVYRGTTTGGCVVTDLVRHQFVGIICDSCGKAHELPEPVERWSARRTDFLDARWAEGWQRWRSRSVRDYCPSCGPRPGHTMRQIAGGDRS